MQMKEKNIYWLGTIIVTKLIRRDIDGRDQL
jgi:hypothetical protein